jgi:hypothetical protein
MMSQLRKCMLAVTSDSGAAVAKVIRKHALSGAICVLSTQIMKAWLVPGLPCLPRFCSSL